MRVKSSVALLLLTFLVLLAVGCSNTEDPVNSANNNDNNIANGNNENDPDIENDEEAYEPEEATVRLQIHWGEGLFESNFQQHVEEALPHITLEHIQVRDHNDFEENMTAGVIPDLIMSSDFRFYNDADMLRDQNPLIDKHGLDISRLDPNMIETLYEHSREGELHALPLYRPGYMTNYNRDVFDAFGVSYPEDGMTWDDMIDLAHEVTGDIDGNPVHGLWGDKDQITQVGLRLLDPETNEINIMDNEDLRVFLERQQQIFSIPGNLPERDSTEELAEYLYSGPGSADLSLEFAIAPGRAGNGQIGLEENAGAFIDWVTIPTWGGDYPDYSMNTLYHNIWVTKHSENPDAAFEVLQYLLSDEYQTWWVSENAELSPVVSDEIQSQFAVNHENAEGWAARNWEAQFDLPGAPIPQSSPFEGDVVEPTFIRAYELLLQGVDINTALREMEDMAEGIVRELEGMN